MPDSLMHVGCNVFGVGNTGASPSVGVAVVYGTEVSVIGEGREVCGSVVGIAVEGASIEFKGGVECVMYGCHEGGGDGPVVVEVEFAPLGFDGVGSWVVSV